MAEEKSRPKILPRFLLVIAKQTSLFRPMQRFMQLRDAHMQPAAAIRARFSLTNFQAE
jgi:hypothetical protein